LVAPAAPGKADVLDVPCNVVSLHAKLMENRREMTAQIRRGLIGGSETIDACLATWNDFCDQQERGYGDANRERLQRWATARLAAIESRAASVESIAKLQEHFTAAFAEYERKFVSPPPAAKPRRAAAAADASATSHAFAGTRHACAEATALWWTAAQGVLWRCATVVGGTSGVDLARVTAERDTCRREATAAKADADAALQTVEAKLAAETKAHEEVTRKLREASEAAVQEATTAASKLVAAAEAAERKASASADEWRSTAQKGRIENETATAARRDLEATVVTLKHEISGARATIDMLQSEVAVTGDLKETIHKLESQCTRLKADLLSATTELANVDGVYQEQIQAQATRIDALAADNARITDEGRSAAAATAAEVRRLRDAAESTRAQVASAQQELSAEVKRHGATSQRMDELRRVNEAQAISIREAQAEVRESDRREKALLQLQGASERDRRDLQLELAGVKERLTEFDDVKAQLEDHKRTISDKKEENLALDMSNKSLTKIAEREHQLYEEARASLKEATKRRDDAIGELRAYKITHPDRPHPPAPATLPPV
jgi:DNA repair exonuclease SbcCD ATPase subunit